MGLHELSYIKDGYADLYHELDLNKTTSDIGKLTKYILDVNIKVHHINILFCYTSNTRNSETLAEIRKFYKNYHNGRFTDEEDEIICENWKNLYSSCYINDSKSLLKQMNMKENFQSLNQKRQRNVIGCFLSRNLSRMRHGSDVCGRLKIAISTNMVNRKKFSPEEDMIILDEVAEHGDGISTWKTLTHKLNRGEKIIRSYSPSIRNRYFKLVNSSFSKKGKWTIEEDKSLLEHLFTNKPCSIDTVTSINFLSISNNEICRDMQSIHYHFKVILKPILLNYHLGTLNSNWKYNFFIHAINKNYKSAKEVIWEELLNLFPGQSQLSLMIELSNAVKNEQNQNKNLNYCDAIKEHARKIRNIEDYSDSQKSYRQKIVDIYLKCTMHSLK